MLLAFTLTLIAGLATILGGVLGMQKSMGRSGRLSVALAFAAGAMLCVSFLDILPAAIESLTGSFGRPIGLVALTISLIIGALFVCAIDKMIPCSNSVKCASHPRWQQCRYGQRDMLRQRARLLRSGMVIALIMAIHNFPEGIVTFTGALHDVALGVSLAFAIALHNIPEGISIASPIYAATSSKVEALKYTLLSALAEPLGAVFGYVLFLRTLPDSVHGMIFAATAGMMIYVSLSELLPSARLHASWTFQPFAGAVLGLGVMAMSVSFINIG